MEPERNPCLSVRFSYFVYYHCIFVAMQCKGHVATRLTVICHLLAQMQLRAAISNGERELEAMMLALGGKFKSQSAVRALVGA